MGNRLRQVSKRDAAPAVLKIYQELFGDRDPVAQPGTATGTPGDYWTTYALVPEILTMSRDSLMAMLAPGRALEARYRELAILRAGIVGKVICSYIGNNEDLHVRMASGEITVEITPQGTLAERMRAAGAGIPAFYTPAAVGTELAEGRETRVFNGREYLLELALPLDYAFIRAYQADGTPTVIVDGRYRLTPQTAGGEEPFVRLVTWLVAQRIAHHL